MLFVRAGQALSLQYHEHKDESWLVQCGRASLELGLVGGELETTEIGRRRRFRYRPGTVHRVTAIEDTTIIEVSTPHLDDVVRLEDRYGRPERDASGEPLPVTRGEAEASPRTSTTLDAFTTESEHS